MAGWQKIGTRAAWKKRFELHPVFHSTGQFDCLGNGSPHGNLVDTRFFHIARNGNEFQAAVVFQSLRVPPGGSVMNNGDGQRQGFHVVN